MRTVLVRARPVRSVPRRAASWTVPLAMLPMRLARDTEARPPTSQLGSKLHPSPLRHGLERPGCPPDAAGKATRGRGGGAKRYRWVPVTRDVGAVRERVECPARPAALRDNGGRGVEVLARIVVDHLLVVLATFGGKLEWVGRETLLGERRVCRAELIDIPASMRCSDLPPGLRNRPPRPDRLPDIGPLRKHPRTEVTLLCKFGRVVRLEPDGVRTMSRHYQQDSCPAPRY